MSDDALRHQLEASLGTTYIIERELGGGGMSRVFVADEVRLRRKVVIKVLLPELTHELNVERFEREIQLAASLQQANIVPVLSACDVGGLPYYMMPYVEGESLRARLQRGPLPIDAVIAVGREVGKALAFAHAHGVIHRDIKPDNVLLSGGTAVVTDFGIAKAISASRTGTVDGTGITQRGTSMGTPAYMSPEQIAGDADLDYRTDLYSVGCLLYELLAGRAPFADRVPQRTLAAHLAEEPVPVGERREDCPPRLASLVTRLLAKEPRDRPPDAQAMITALDDVASHNASSPAGPASGRTATRQMLAIYAAASVAMALLTKVAVGVIGLPEWVFPTAVVLLLLGLPALLATAYVQRVSRHATAATPALTPKGTDVSRAPAGTWARLALRAAPHVSWRRTWRTGALVLGAFAMLVALYMALRAVGIGPEGSLFASGALTRDDQLLIADLSVARDDSAIVPILGEAVRAAMSQSAAIHLVAPSAVAVALELMRRDRATRVSGDLAREVAQRVGATAVLGGRVARIGTGYALSLELTAAQGGAPLASYQATADAPKDLLTTIDALSRKMRARMGESLRLVQRTPPLEQATTTSLDALRKYSDGIRAADVDNDYDRAVRLLREAVALDTSFALAWRSLASALANGIFARPAIDSALERAARYADRLPDREKYLVLGAYAGDRAKALNFYRAAYAADSMSSTAVAELAKLYWLRRELDSAAHYARRQVALNPGVASGSELAIVLEQSGNRAVAVRLLDSLQAADSSAARNLVFLRARILTTWGVGHMESAAAVSEAMRRVGTGRARIEGTFFLAHNVASRGQVERSRLIWLEHDSLRRVEYGNRNVPMVAAVFRAGDEVKVRDRPTEAVRRLDSIEAKGGFTRLAPEARFALGYAAIYYARARRSDKAEAILTRMQRDRATGLGADPRFVERIRGEIALSRGNAAEAVRLFQYADRRLDDGGYPRCEGCALFGVARSFDRGGQGDSAIVYYERYLALPFGLRWDSDQEDNGAFAGSHKRLGELYDARHDRARAMKHYSAFLDLWKDAAPDLQPVVLTVRKRYAELVKQEGR